MSEFLKGNFQIKNQPKESTKAEMTKEEELKEKFKKAALGSIGGSMVYVERTELTWDGADE
ncbi:MAG: hypothetical protein WC635_16055 [Bacteriovorax sp.]|jgi:hypothetical protein